MATISLGATKEVDYLCSYTTLPFIMNCQYSACFCKAMSKAAINWASFTVEKLRELPKRVNISQPVYIIHGTVCWPWQIQLQQICYSNMRLQVKEREREHVCLCYRQNVVHNMRPLSFLVKVTQSGPSTVTYTWCVSAKCLLCEYASCLSLARSVLHQEACQKIILYLCDHFLMCKYL